MSLRSFSANYSCYHYYYYNFLSKHISFAQRVSTCKLRISARAMSHRPNFQGGRRGGPNSRGRGGARRGGGGGGGGRGGGRGEQRWWDPVWRAERLRQNQAEV